MLDKFRDLSDSGKITVIGVFLLVFIGAIIFVSLFVTQNNQVPVEDDTSNMPYPTQSLVPGSTTPAEPTTEPSVAPSGTPEPTTEPSPEPTTAEPALPYSETTISVEDQQAAQNIAKDGVTEFYNIDKDENLNAKSEELRKYFAPESQVFSSGSIEETYDLEVFDAENYIISRGTIDYLDPVGGDIDGYKLIVGLSSKVQFNRAETSPQILESNNTLSLILSKESGSWLITSIED